MSRIWRNISVVGGLVGVLAGTMLLMGNLRSGNGRVVQTEQARVEALARLWETRLDVARSTFRDQLVHHGIMSALDNPADWSPWRIQSKLESARDDWGRDGGVPRALVFMTDDGSIRASVGDTTRFGESLSALARSTDADLVVLPKSGGMAQLLAMVYYSPSDDPELHPGRLVALVDPAGLFAATGNVPHSWLLLAAPGSPMSSAGSELSHVGVSDATWPLLLTEGSGHIPQTDGSTLCFSRVHIPGMTPLLLIEAVKPVSAAASILAALFIVLGAGLLLIRKPRPVSEPVNTPEQNAPEPEPATGEAANLRQIFQTIEDPLCVVDSTGRVSRANRTAQEWFHIRKGKPDTELTFECTSGVLNAQEFLARAAEEPLTVSGPCRVRFNDAFLDGAMHVARLYREEDGHGPVLIHFHAQPQKVPHGEYAPPVDEPRNLDATCPFPVLGVTIDGLVGSFNLAARQTCPRLDETPLVTEILPGLESYDIPDLLHCDDGTTFETLFGSSPHEFTVVRHGAEVMLYGHPLSASKKLEIELKQAQENFFTLCSAAPVPVLMVDPRDHVIIEANAAAADLFEVTPASLRGQPFDSLTPEPWDFTANEESFYAVTSSGREVRCMFHYELIKVEGIPMLLVLLEREPELYIPVNDGESFEHVPDEHAVSAPVPPPPMPPGPGMLITLNPTVREVARRLLDRTGHLCEVFSSLDDATVWLITHDQKPELVAIDLTDFDDSESWIEELRSRCGAVPCIAFTDGELYTLPNGGLNALLPKPFDLDSLADALISVQVETADCQPA